MIYFTSTSFWLQMKKLTSGLLQHRLCALEHSQTTLTCVCCQFYWWWLLCLFDQHCGPCQSRPPHGAAAYGGKRSSEETSCTGYYKQHKIKRCKLVIPNNQTHITYFLMNGLCLRIKNVELLEVYGPYSLSSRQEKGAHSSLHRRASLTPWDKLQPGITWNARGRVSPENCYEPTHILTSIIFQLKLA